MNILPIALSVLLQAAAPAPAAAGPVLRIPGQPDRVVTVAMLSGRHRTDVRVDSQDGDTIVYHGAPLLNVLEDAGFDVRTMPGERRAAGEVVVVTARDGYAAVFSTGELMAARGGPLTYLVWETSAGPLPPEQGPIRVVTLGQAARSPYALARIEVRAVASNPATRATPPKG
jgi:DMSO/TMAO reductase YedYZ molybdopterin-dependent catalytic subunit